MTTATRGAVIDGAVPATEDIAALIADAPVPNPTLARTFLAMMARELYVLRRSAVSTFTRSVIQPLLFAFAFAYVLPKVGGGLHVASGGGQGGVNFATVLVPGLAASMLLTQGVFGTLAPLAMEFSWQRTIDDRALAPITVQMLAVQKIAAGAVQSFVGACIVFPVVLVVHAPGQAPQVHVTDWPLFALIMMTGSTLVCSMVMLLGTLMEPRKVQAMTGLVLVPATMLGCVYYPWESLHSILWLQILTLVNPMVYMSEGLRAVLTPSTGHLPLWAVVIALVDGTILFTGLATRTFARRVVS
ncbi:MAG TPA: ABC transporter permease [Trebonia sp.]|jgi:ABC-2 type transport system permease protein|nr:ABC transporter permease [Trebonia sp.]